MYIILAMSYGYSKDLREKALAYYDRGHTRSEVCDVFGIHRHTFSSWLKLRSASQDLTPRISHTRRPHKIDAERLKACIAERPNAYLWELGELFGVSDVAILKACRRLGITRKKNRAVSGA
jgi:transposase